MEPTTIIMTVIIFILFYVLYHYVWSKPAMLMSGIASGTAITSIDASKIDSGSGTGSVNFSYSVWFNINDWNYHYGEKKPLFSRASTATNTSCPYVYFDAYKNDLMIDVNTTGGNTTCTVHNVPIQKWVHLFISVYGQSLDTYINGKLVSTCVLGGIPVIDTTKPIYITPGIGFNGWVTQFQYWADATDPQTVWNLYKDGNGTNIFSNLLGDYGIKLSLMNGEVEQNSISI
jgi:hypothetical protein